MEKDNMQLYTIALIARFGLEVAQTILINMKNVVTIDDAIAACARIKTTEQYIAESAARLGLPERPLGT